MLCAGAYVSFPIRFEGAIRGLRIHGMGHITTCVDPFGERWAVARMITVQVRISNIFNTTVANNLDLLSWLFVHLSVLSISHDAVWEWAQIMSDSLFLSLVSLNERWTSYAIILDQPIEFDTLERGHLEMTIYTVNRDLLSMFAIYFIHTTMSMQTFSLTWSAFSIRDKLHKTTWVVLPDRKKDCISCSTIRHLMLPSILQQRGTWCYASCIELTWLEICSDVILWYVSPLISWYSYCPL